MRFEMIFSQLFIVRMKRKITYFYGVAFQHIEHENQAIIWRLCFCLNCSSIWSFFVVQPLHRLTKRCKWMRNMKLLSIIYQWSQLFVSLLDEKNDFCFHLLYINVDILLLYQKQLRYGNCDNKDDCELRYFTFFFLCSVKEIHFWHMIM